MSAETDALIAWMSASGVAHEVTATTGRYVSAADPCSPHAKNSYHCARATPTATDPLGRGLAVDFAGPDLDAIYKALAPLGPLCAEMIYGTTQWRNGKLVAQYDFAPNIWNHVHIAVPEGIIVGPKGGSSVPAAADPIVCIAPSPSGGGYWLVSASGNVFAFGDAKYYGGLQVQPDGSYKAVGRP